MEHMTLDEPIEKFEDNYSPELIREVWMYAMSEKVFKLIDWEHEPDKDFTGEEKDFIYKTRNVEKPTLKSISNWIEKCPTERLKNAFMKVKENFPTYVKEFPKQINDAYFLMLYTWKVRFIKGDKVQIQLYIGDDIIELQGTEMISMRQFLNKFYNETLRILKITPAVWGEYLEFIHSTGDIKREVYEKDSSILEKNTIKEKFKEEIEMSVLVSKPKYCLEGDGYIYCDGDTLFVPSNRIERFAQGEELSVEALRRHLIDYIKGPSKRVRINKHKLIRFWQFKREMFNLDGKEVFELDDKGEEISPEQMRIGGVE